MEMPRPTDAHKKLELFAGTWTGEETMFPSQWDPGGGKATGKSASKVSADGFVVAGDYEQSRSGQRTFAGHAVYSYDPAEKRYVLHWWDSMGMSVEVFYGRFEGQVITFESRNPMGHSKLVYDFSKPGEIKSRMEMSPDGKTYKPMMEGVYRRQG